MGKPRVRAGSKYTDSRDDMKLWPNAKLLNMIVSRLPADVWVSYDDTEKIIDELERRIVSNPNRRGLYKTERSTDS